MNVIKYKSVVVVALEASSAVEGENYYRSAFSCTGTEFPDSSHRLRSWVCGRTSPEKHLRGPVPSVRVENITGLHAGSRACRRWRIQKSFRRAVIRSRTMRNVFTLDRAVQRRTWGGERVNPPKLISSYGLG